MPTYSSNLAKKNPMDREAWWPTSPWGHKESNMAERQSTHTYSCEKEQKFEKIFAIKL